MIQYTQRELCLEAFSDVIRAVAKGTKSVAKSLAPGTSNVVGTAVENVKKFGKEITKGPKKYVKEYLNGIPENVQNVKITGVQEIGKNLYHVRFDADFNIDGFNRYTDNIAVVAKRGGDIEKLDMVDILDSEKTSIMKNLKVSEEKVDGTDAELEREAARQIKDGDRRVSLMKVNDALDSNGDKLSVGDSVTWTSKRTGRDGSGSVVKIINSNRVIVKNSKNSQFAMNTELLKKNNKLNESSSRAMIFNVMLLGEDYI